MIRKSVLLVLSLFVFGAALAHAQTTYTVTADSCGGKANFFCTLPVSASPDNGITQIVLDNRNNFGNMYIGGWAIGQVHGVYSGFVSNPDGTRHDFYGTGYFVSDDGKTNGTFNYLAHYVATCSGRACVGTLGWHYVILAGSTVETN